MEDSDSESEQDEMFFSQHNIQKKDLTSFDKFDIQTKDCCHHHFHKSTNRIYSYDMRTRKWFIVNDYMHEQLLDIISKHK